MNNEDLSMFKPMRRKERMTEQETNEIILNQGEYGILGTVGQDSYPYALPISYVYFDKCIYFHCAKEGQKLDNINYNHHVSFCVVGKTKVLPENFSTAFESVIAFGKASIVEDETLRYAVLEALIKKYSADYYEKGLTYIKNAAVKTCIVKIEIEHLTGKERKE